jgi:hypothetical protein
LAGIHSLFFVEKGQGIMAPVRRCGSKPVLLGLVFDVESAFSICAVNRIFITAKDMETQYCRNHDSSYGE